MTIGKRIPYIAALLLVSVATEPAAAESCGQSTNVGRMFGSLAGALGRKIAGAEFGNSLSSTISCALSKAERERAQQTQNAALNSGKTGTASRRTWQSGERPGVVGGTEVVSRSVVSGGAQCAVQRTFVTDVNGEQKSVDREMCQQSDGTWATV